MAMKERNRVQLSAEEIASFCEQIAMMLNSGLALYDGMEALVQTHQKSAHAALYERLNQQMLGTGSLYEALKKCDCWPSYLVEMTGIGERTGRLEEVMSGLAAYYSREGRIRRAIISAVTYPLVLGIMMVLILLVMIVKVLPVFRRVLGNLGVEMTASGNVMMRMGVNIGWIMLVVVCAAVIAVLVCCLLVKTGHKDRMLQTLRHAFPPIRKISMRIASARVASVLSMMLSGGFPLDEALEMTPMVLDDAVAREQVKKVREQVAEDKAFSDALSETTLFDEVYNAMIRMGIVAGCVDSVMAKIAREYENRAEDSIADLVSIIEPSLVAVLAVVIGAVLLSVMLPMAGIISSIL